MDKYTITDSNGSTTDVDLNPVHYSHQCGNNVYIEYANPLRYPRADRLTIQHADEHTDDSAGTRQADADAARDGDSA